MIALDLNDRQLDAIFVVGSADLDPVVSSMDTVAAAPVISAAEADMAMSRGAAVASAMAVNSIGRRQSDGADEAAWDVEDNRLGVCPRRRGRHLGDFALGRPWSAGDVGFAV